jgi:general secretion pathway protein I
MGIRRGFTLLEVMVAVAILGLGLTAIMSAQAGAFASSAHARNLSIATGLARCKMNEIEERLMVVGYPYADESESGVCCEGDLSPFRCTWKIELPKLPEPKLGELDLQAGLGDGGLGGLSSLDPSTIAKPGAGIGDMAQGLAGLTGMGAPGGGGDGLGGLGGITSMVMGMVYPSLKLVMEASTRRVSVTINWPEGKQERGFEVVQWVTNPQQAGVMGELPEGAEPSAGSPAAGPSSPFGGGLGPTTGRPSVSSPLGGGIR